MYRHAWSPTTVGQRGKLRAGGAGSRGWLGTLTQWEEKKEGQGWGEWQRGSTPIPRPPSPTPLIRRGTSLHLCFLVCPASGWLFRRSHQESEEKSQLEHLELKIPTVSFQLQGPAAGGGEGHIHMGLTFLVEGKTGATAGR